MNVTVRFFASLRERVGVSEMTLHLPDGARVDTARESLLDRYPILSDLMPRVAYAVNRVKAPLDAMLREGDELAILPPVSGG